MWASRVHFEGKKSLGPAFALLLEHDDYRALQIGNTAGM